MKRFLTLLCSVLGVSFFGCKESTVGTVVQISPEQLHEIIQRDTVQLIDVRTPKEFNKEHIKSSKNINFFSSSFSNTIKELDLEKPVYIYCRSGKRSAKSVKTFQKAGFKTIYNLEGGILNWKGNKLRTEIP